MARDEDKKPTRARKDEGAAPKKATRSRATSARAGTATAEPAKRTTAKSAAKGASRPPAAKGDPSVPGGKASGRSAGRSASSRSTSRNRAQTEPTQRDFLEPTHDEIARRAYLRWRETGNEDALENWIQAERELREAELGRGK